MVLTVGPLIRVRPGAICRASEQGRSLVVPYSKVLELVNLKEAQYCGFPKASGSEGWAP